MDKLIIGIIIFTFQQATSQSTTSDNRTKSTRSFYSSVDTLPSKYRYYSILRVNWMDSIIEIDKTDRIKYDLEEARKFRRDSIYIPTPSDTLTMNEMRTIGAQNCHSYALEKYFNSIQVDNSLFTKWTSLKENRYMNSILTTTFVKTSSFDTKRKKCKECSFDKGSLIVFRNKWNTPIHTVYFDGQYFHSKYGALRAKAESSVDHILKKYWDSTKIEEYRLDNEKIMSRINKGQK